MYQKELAKASPKPLNFGKLLPWKEIGLIILAIVLSVVIIGCGFYFLLRSYATIF